MRLRAIPVLFALALLPLSTLPSASAGADTDCVTVNMGSEALMLQVRHGEPVTHWVALDLGAVYVWFSPSTCAPSPFQWDGDGPLENLPTPPELP